MTDINVDLFLEQGPQKKYDELAKAEQSKDEAARLLNEAFGDLDPSDQQTLLDYLNAIEGNQPHRFEVLNALRRAHSPTSNLLASVTYSNTAAWRNLLSNFTELVNNPPDIPFMSHFGGNHY